MALDPLPQMRNFAHSLCSPLLELGRLLQELQPRMAQQYARQQRPQVLRHNCLRVGLQTGGGDKTAGAVDQ